MSFKQTLIFLFLSAICNYSCFSQSVTFTIDLKKKAQTIDNIGASGAWFSEGIGKYWEPAKKERMAELLFSKGFDSSGNPLGIGLSAWRFNIGGGTTEQGDSSGISNPVKRVECFLSPNGSYDWNKQQGYLWFVKKAAAYKVENLIAFSNTPPVQFTQNGLGFKLAKDFKANLADNKYGTYSSFLATVIRHFDSVGLHFDYISPVNEPQWDWSAKFGKMNQEGSPWQNEAICKIATCLDSVLTAQKLSTKILMPEAGILTALYSGNGHASKQIQQFFSPQGSNYVGSLEHMLPLVAGHSYFTDTNDTTIIKVRGELRDTAAKYKIRFWQSEYCMLGDGYKEGKTGNISGIDCALFLAKMIYHDLVVADASAWHFWNAWEPGNADVNNRYYLIALKNNAANTQGDFVITKNLWALGHYSRFIRPGMQRLILKRSDTLNEIQSAKNLMLSAFTDNKQIVVVAINYTGSTQEINLDIKGVKSIKGIQQYFTDASSGNNMKPRYLTSLKKIELKCRSLSTFLINLN